MTILKIIATLLGVLGIYITYEIRVNKALHKSGKKMVCLPGHKCDDVILSDYSKFLGIDLEFMGFVYYSAAVLFYLIYLFVPSLITETVSFIALGITFGGFLFSIYLTYIQIFKLKSLCSWCLLSALASTLIFFIAYAATMVSSPDIFVYIEQLAPYIKIFQLVTLVVGALVFTFLEILIFTFLKDFNLTIKESHKIKTVAQMGWFVIFLLILNNIGIYLPQYVNPETQVNYSLMFTEVAIIIFIIFNNAISTINILPELQKESLFKGINKKAVEEKKEKGSPADELVKAEEKHTLSILKIQNYRRITVIQSAVSLLLWYGLVYVIFFL